MKNLQPISNLDIMSLPELKMNTALTRSYELNFVGGIQCVLDAPVPMDL